jgi:hypothetical protein
LDRIVHAALSASRAGCVAWPSAQHDDAFDAVLGFSDTKRFTAALQRDVAPAQFKNLADAHPRFAQEREDQPVGLRSSGDSRIQRPLLLLLADWAGQAATTT